MNLVRNMSRLDRAVRAAFGALLIYLAFAVPTLSDPVVAALLTAFGLINIGSAALGHCPAYRLADLSTLTSSRRG